MSVIPMNMLPKHLDSPKGTVTLRQAGHEDIERLIQLNQLCFPTMVEENIVWNVGQLRNHLRLFPEGQIVAAVGGQVVGAVSSLIVDTGIDPYRTHTYAGITDGGYFHNHDPEGDTLYGADVYVHPDYRGLRIGHALYAARRELCRRLNRRRILAGGRIHGYADVCDSMSPEEYVRTVEEGRRHDLVLSFQLREGFVVRSVLRNYIRDPRSKNCATLIEWLNPDYRPPEGSEERKVRIACVQYRTRGLQRFSDFSDQVEYFVDAAAGYRSDFVLFPEFFTMQLLSQEGLRRLPSREAIARLGQLEGPFLELMGRLAREYGVHIVAGSHPLARDGYLYNVCPLVFPDGHVVLQPKLHITAEKRDWDLSWHRRSIPYGRSTASEGGALPHGPVGGALRALS
jgi:GNAT superfamily N-acetyltransferase